MVKYLPDVLLPRVTCVMAAANEATFIERKLGVLARQGYPPEKVIIIVVSDASTHDTDWIVAEWASRVHRIRLLRTSRQSGKPTTLNLAHCYIETEIMILIDVRQDITARAIRELRGPRTYDP
jgi:biofilm PGA synthesis N-glycosyltransferase PgaC